MDGYAKKQLVEALGHLDMAKVYLNGKAREEADEAIAHVIRALHTERTEVESGGGI